MISLSCDTSVILIHCLSSLYVLGWQVQSTGVERYHRIHSVNLCVLVAYISYCEDFYFASPPQVESLNQPLPAVRNICNSSSFLPDSFSGQPDGRLQKLTHGLPGSNLESIQLNNLNIDRIWLPL